MPRKYKRQKSDSAYDQALLKQAAEAVQKSVLPLLTAAKEFGVPRSTLRRHLGTNLQQRGGQTIFSKQQEENLRDHIVFMCVRGFPLPISGNCIPLRKKAPTAKTASK